MQGLTGLFILAIIYISLKLGNVLDWPWALVLMPLWVAIFFIILLIALCIWAVWEKP